VVRGDAADADATDAVRLLRMVAEVTGVALVVSDATQQDEASLIADLGTLAGQGTVRLRLLAAASDDVHAAAFAAGIAVDRAPATSIAMIELRRWVIEQAVSRSMHRHGHLIRR